MRITIFSLYDIVRDPTVLVGKFLKLTSNQTLGRKHRVFSIGDGLTLGGLTDKTLPVFCKSND